MSTSDDDTITRTLRTLDAADPAFDESARVRAAATLERILATDAPASAPASAPRRTPPRRTRRLLLAGGVVAAAAAAVVTVPLVTGRGDAFASWSPTPVPLTGAERTAAAEACLVLQGGDTGELAFDPDADASVLIAEARGGWRYVVFTVTGRSGFELQGSCLAPDELIADPRPGEGGFFGSLSRADDIGGPGPRRDAAREDSYATGAIGNRAFAYIEGRVGAEVVGIEVTPPGGGPEVQASVDNGRWAAWWPAGDAAMDNPQLTGAPTYEVTLRDGTVTDAVRRLG